MKLLRLDCCLVQYDLKDVSYVKNYNLYVILRIAIHTICYELVICMICYGFQFVVADVSLVRGEGFKIELNVFRRKGS